jgi:murein DD-endopeptidase MepM/ murein hydrolase activator NlpD
MERIISEDERIRRAEYVSELRKNRIPASSINNEHKKKMSRLTKTFIQVITSMLIFGLIYFINQTNSFAFDSIKPIVSKDIDINEMYNQINGIFKNVSKTINDNVINKDSITNQDDGADKEANKNQSDSSNALNSDKNNSTNNETNQIDSNTTNNNLGNNKVGDNENKTDNDTNNKNNGEGGNDTTEISQADQDIEYIKNNASFIKPVSGTITSGFGTRTPTDIVTANHSGVDIGANSGTDIIASMSGKVVLISNDGDYGNHIEITNGEIMTLYAHCSKIVVNKGDNIEQGQKIAEVGSTGRSTGPHLHFEIRKSNKAVDPQQILDL